MCAGLKGICVSLFVCVCAQVKGIVYVLSILCLFMCEHVCKFCVFATKGYVSLSERVSSYMCFRLIVSM